MAMKRTIWASVCIALAASLSCAQPSGRALTPAEEMELNTLAGQLKDTTRDAKTKLEAAELLLTRTYPQAVESLRDLLADPRNRAAQLAIADAVARRGNGDRSFIDPLMAMLTGDELAVRAAAARALTTYRNDGVAERMIAVAMDAKRDRTVRLVTIGALQRVLDKQSVDALVRLLDDNDAAVRDAAVESLTRLTSIRTFGNDRGQWKRWWDRNKDRDRADWLAELATSLATAKNTLETDNARLRDRLGRAMLDLYAAAAPTERDALLMGFLRDALADVRLAGLTVVDRRLGANEQVSPELRLQVRSLLIDGDSRVRESSALTTASLGEVDAVPTLLDRLAVEEAPSVRQALLTAMGQLRDSRCTPAVLNEINSRHDSVAAAAASALARMAARQTLEGEQRDVAVKALVSRYNQAVKTGEVDSTRVLREAVLTAMGVVRDAAFEPPVRAALEDGAATVRLAAVNAMARIGSPSAAAIIAPLMSDTDRGVRQAAIAAVSTLDGPSHLEAVLERTRAAVEPDAAVRQQAWNEAAAILSRCDSDVLRQVIDSLDGRADAAPHRVRYLQMLTERLRQDNSSDLGYALRLLGLALASAERPVEAAAALAERYQMVQDTPDGGQAWLEWVAALLYADDPSACRTISQQADNAQFAEANKLIEARLAQLRGDGKWQSAAVLVASSLEALNGRLDAAQRRSMQAALDEARQNQVVTDRQKVASLTAQLTAADENARKAAVSELQLMGDRAVRPLCEELRKTVDAGTVESERAILAVLKQLSPRLDGYDPAETKARKLSRIDTWLAE